MDPTSPEGAPSVEYLAEKMARAVVWKEKFIVGAIGSSVTAGHDNCAYDSYENQLERTMAKVWEAAGVEWEVRNAGEGGGCGDSFRNQIFCIAYLFKFCKKSGIVRPKHNIHGS